MHKGEIFIISSVMPFLWNRLLELVILVVDNVVVITAAPAMP